MKNIVLIVVIIAGIASAQKTNQDCYNDNDCGGENWVCGPNRKCECGVAFRVDGPTHDQRCRYVLGTPCQSADECSNLPGAICENHRCICKAGQLAGAKECTPIGNENDECMVQADCIQRISPADNNRECRQNKCVCKLGFHFGNDNRCKNSRALNEVCELPDDCFQADSNNNNALQCSDSVNGRLCICNDGYVQEGDRCNGSGTLFLLSLSALLLLVASLLKI